MCPPQGRHPLLDRADGRAGRESGRARGPLHQPLGEYGGNCSLALAAKAAEGGRFFVGVSESE